MLGLFNCVIILNKFNPKPVELSKGDVPAMIENLNAVVKGLG